MGKDHDILKAARNDDFHKLLEIFAGKSGKGLTGTIKQSIKGKRRKDALRPKWPVGEDGAFLVLPTLPPGVRIDCRDELGSTPLINAALGGHVDTVACLLVHGANINAKDSKGNTALHMAAWQERERSADVVQMLLTNGADANARNAEGATPLHNACQNGQQFVVLLLVDHGADCHLTDQDGSTALDVAARYNRKEVVSLLLDHDPTIVKSTRSLREAAKTGREAVVKTLLDKGMDCNETDLETQDTALHEAVRYYRTRIVEMLMGYGADPYIKNGEGQTPSDIVSEQPQSTNRDALMAVIEEYKDKEVIVPAIVLDKQRQRRAQQTLQNDDDSNEFKKGTRSYPRLRVRSRWTEDVPHMRSLADTTAPCTNLLSDDASSRWVASRPGRHWVAFDFSKLYTLTALTITGSPSKSMPKDFQLEVANSLEGPWRVIKTFVGPCDCPPDQIEPGTGTFQQYYAGFHATSRFWRLMILRNHGSTSTMLHGVAFHGVDALLKKWFAEQGLTQYFDPFVEAGCNQLADLEHMTEGDMAKVVTLAGHRKKLQMAIRELRGEKTIFDRIIFFVQPPLKGRENHVLRLFEVQANPGIQEEVELVVHGGATMYGTTVRKLIPNGPNPSLAYFDDIILSPPGRYQLEVRGRKNPKISCMAASPVEIDVGKKKRSALQVLFADYEPLLNF